MLILKTCIPILGNRKINSKKSWKLLVFPSLFYKSDLLSKQLKKSLISLVNSYPFKRKYKQNNMNVKQKLLLTQFKLISIILPISSVILGKYIEHDVSPKYLDNTSKKISFQYRLYRIYHSTNWLYHFSYPDIYQP